MQVSVETLAGLERKLVVSVPTEKIEEEVGLRLKSLARKAKVDGFRPGKAPMHMVVSRFSDGVRHDVAKEMVQSTLFEALKKHDLTPAGMPTVDLDIIEPGKDFSYSAVFEIFPDIQINELASTDDVEQLQAVVSDADVTDMLTKLREQNKDWVSVTRPAALHDKVVIDFKGFLNGELFDGGQAEDYSLVLGSASMIPGFEEGLVGAELGKVVDVNVTFPESYGHADLAGKEVLFQVTIHDIMEGKLPELDDAFAEKFNIKEGGIDALSKDIRQNMERELERRLGSMNREKAFDVLLAKNKFDVPQVLINQEIENLKHDMYHRIFGHEHSDHEKIPDFPRELFEEQAVRRVHLGLLFSAYVEKHEMTVDNARVDAMIEKFAGAYEDPNELRAWYQQDKKRLADIEALVMEEMVADKILSDAHVKNKTMDYQSVMNPKKDTDDKGE